MKRTISALLVVHSILTAVLVTLPLEVEPWSPEVMVCSRIGAAGKNGFQHYRRTRGIIFGVASPNLNPTTQGEECNPILHWCPTEIHIDRVTHSYPNSIWRKLTSSVPRREYALNNVTLTLFPNATATKTTTTTQLKRSVILLVGASSSGKSTLLQMILGEERPSIQGSVRILSSNTHAGSCAKPIHLDERGVLSASRGSQTTVATKLSECIFQYNVGQKQLRTRQKEDIAVATTSLLNEMARVFDLSLEQPLSTISPSEYYRIRLAMATLESSLHGLSTTNSDSSSSSNNNNNSAIVLPGPILLLDEWMDVETSLVVQKVVHPSLHRVVHELGGIVVCVTHKPQLFYSSPQTQKLQLQPQPPQKCTSVITKITLSGGKILSIES